MTSNTLLTLSLDLYALGLSISDWHAPAKMRTDQSIAIPEIVIDLALELSAVE